VKYLSEGSDVFVSDYMPMDVPFKCGRNGCGVEFCERDNTDIACRFHPDNVLFHEGLKGWKCCTKRETDFDDALKIPGCAVGRHVPEEPKLAKSKSSQTTSALPTEMEVHLSGDGKEVYSDKRALRPTTTTTSTTSTLASPPVPKKEMSDPPDAVILPGTKCNHATCSATYVDESSRIELCTYHSGVPLFHEGSKGWTCCKTKALEFDELFKIEGCTEGRHKFVKDPVPAASIRRDFYQSPTSVIISFYSKAVKPDSVVTFEERKFRVSFHLATGERYEEDVLLSHPCRPSESSFSILGTKVEIILKKNGEDWDPFHL